MSLQPRPTLASVKARCCALMAEILYMPVRGFDTAKAKQDKRDELDDQLDLYNLMRCLEDQ